VSATNYQAIRPCGWVLQE